MKHALAAYLCLNRFGPALCEAADLNPETVKAWEAYLETVTSKMNARLSTGGQFLWVDELPERIRRVRNGEILAFPQSEDGQFDVPHGLIPHWTAAAFIPDATLHSVLAVVNDHQRYKVFYKPTVVDSERISCNGRQQHSPCAFRKACFW